MSDSAQWETHVTEELKKITEALKPLGFELDPKQPHVSGERFLMTREKLVLVGYRTEDSRKVIIKISDNPKGQKEIIQEKRILDLITNMAFSGDTLLLAKEVYFSKRSPYLIWITEFIPQEQVFASYSLEEQFFMVMREFEAQESFYANTFEHMNIVKGIFPVTQAEDYIRRFNDYKMGSDKSEALRLLHDNKQLVETRSNYLTHTDFVPSNFRVSNRKIYMIDLSSMHFGNRYEGLARFLNYCIIHNPRLGESITEYIKNNRGSDEYLCLRLMRIYKAGYLIDHYLRSLDKTEGNLHTLIQKRIVLWQVILESLVADIPIEPSLIKEYKFERDGLRSKGEFQRQKEFNLI